MVNNKTAMKATNVLLKDLKIGDRLVLDKDTHSDEYSDLVISKISTTKTGRVHIWVDGIRNEKDGSTRPVLGLRYWYSPKSGDKYSIQVWREGLDREGYKYEILKP